MFREGSQIGLYKLDRKLGKGGFGEVWLATRKSKFVTTKVAVKLPHDEQIDHETIKQEAQLWEQASGHPNILPIIDADEYDGQIVIVSEYAPDYYMRGEEEMTSVGLPVIITSSKGKIRRQVPVKGKYAEVSFDSIPCNETISIQISDLSYQPDYFVPMIYKRFIPCNKPVVNLGKMKTIEKN